MSRRRRTPETSILSRGRTVAYARKSKGGPSEPDTPAEPEPKVEPKVEAKIEANAEPAAPPAAQAAPATPPVAEPIRPEPAPALEEPVRGRTNTIGMPPELVVGEPPPMPAPSVATPSVTAPIVTAPSATASTPSADAVEAPTHMPGPRHIPVGNPDDHAAPPGRVGPGDSRSLRRAREFALIYRRDNAVITRFGEVGTRGQWRVVEYPTVAAASHAYARECSRFVSEGFSDYRD
jgi:hypothetical protein